MVQCVHVLYGMYYVLLYFVWYGSVSGIVWFFILYGRVFCIAGTVWSVL